MPRNKDIWLILAVLLGALIVFLISQQMPKATVDGRTADVTMAPDAIEYIDNTEKPDTTDIPAQTDIPEVTAVPAETVIHGATAAPSGTQIPEVTAIPAEPVTHGVTAAPSGTQISEVSEMPTEKQLPEMTEIPAERKNAETTAVPAVTESTAAQMPVKTRTSEEKPAAGPMIGPVLEQSQEPVKGHVVIMVKGRQYGDPIPMDRDKIITVRQDENTINRIHITRDSVHMESSTCENQDCIGEGAVTFDNYRVRILGTFIVCLPNGVTVEMVPVGNPEAQQ